MAKALQSFENLHCRYKVVHIDIPKYNFIKTSSSQDVNKWLPTTMTEATITLSFSKVAHHTEKRHKKLKMAKSAKLCYSAPQRLLNEAL